MSNDPQANFEAMSDAIKQLQDSGMAKPMSPGRIVETAARYAGTYPVPNLAVDFCEKSFQNAFTKAKEEGKSNSEIRVIGKLAYCNAMPRPYGASNIREFIACVLYAMSVDIISGPEGARLLYGAQVAHGALTKRPKKRGKSSHTSNAAAEPTQAKSTI